MAEQVAARGRAAGMCAASSRGGPPRDHAGRERDAGDPGRRSDRDVREHDPPGQLVVPLVLADERLQRQQDDQREREAPPAIGPPAAELQNEQQQRRDDDVGRRDAHVHVGRVQQVAHAADVLAAGMRTRRRGERAAHDQREGGQDAAARQPRETRGRGRRSRRRPCARAAIAARPVATTATRKWLITSTGLRSKSTVTAPSGICPNVSSATPAGQPARRAIADLARREVGQRARPGCPPARSPGSRTRSPGGS